MSQKQLMTWADDTGLRSNLTPVITKWLKVSNGTSAGAVPAITRFGASNGGYVFTYDVVEAVYWEADSGDNAMPALLRYKSGIVSPNDNNMTIVESPSGTFPIIVNTIDGNDEAIPDVQIELFNLTGQRIRTFKTNSSGTHTVALDAATFTARLTKSGFNFEIESFTVTQGATINFTGEIVVPSVPPAGCQVLLFPIYNPSLIIERDSIISAEPVSPNYVHEEAIINSQAVATLNEDLGCFELFVAKGATFRITGILEGKTFLYNRITITSDNVRQYAEYLTD